MKYVLNIIYDVVVIQIDGTTHICANSNKRSQIYPFALCISNSQLYIKSIIIMHTTTRHLHTYKSSL